MSARSSRPCRWFSARAVTTTWAGPAWATSTAARDPFGGALDVVDRLVLVAGEVLDREAGQPGGDGAPRGLGHPLGAVGEAVLEVGGDRKVGRGHDLGGVAQRLLGGHRAVKAPERRRIAAARRRQRLETERGQQTRRAGVPRVGQQQRRPGRWRARKCSARSDWMVTTSETTRGEASLAVHGLTDRRCPRWAARATTTARSGARSRQFRSFVSDDGSTGFPLQAGRYHLYVARACPWAHRTLIGRRLMGLEDAIAVSFVDPLRDERGWAFTGGDYVDPINGFHYLSEAYAAADPDYDARVSVPVLWDTEAGTIVNNESADILRMLSHGVRPAGRAPGGAGTRRPCAGRSTRSTRRSTTPSTTPSTRPGSRAGRTVYEARGPGAVRHPGRARRTAGRPPLPLRARAAGDRLAAVHHPRAL